MQRQLFRIFRCLQHWESLQGGQCEGARIRDVEVVVPSKFAKEMLYINLFTTVLAYAALLIFLCLPILKTINFAGDFERNDCVC